jgi:trehalose 6-phosphate synthase/phosphatase
MESTTKKRLVVVSNRLPFKLLERSGKITLQPSDGGLVSALKSYFDRQTEDKVFDEKVWIGSADFPEKRWERFASSPTSEPVSFSVEPIFIESRLYSRYYNGFSNATLWPTLHYFATYAVFDSSYFEAYEQVNRMFADKLAAIIRPDDVIWIHDYQLFLLPEMIREKFPDVAIGFFLHIPFPSYEVFRMLHRLWKEKIIRGMLGADLIGFHTHEYVQHFLKAVRMIGGYDHQFRSINMGNRIAKADLFPLGIDYGKFHEATKDEAIMEKKIQILSNFSERKIIFSVDRLDYTKGVTNRLSGFEQFLEQYPEWHKKVVFVLVVVPSREIISKYNERKNLIEEQVGRINGKWSTLDWQPVIYRYGHLPFDELCAMYQAAEVGLITPLRDGMNLVAKEYVASRVDQRGVLVLSELAGAANELGEALLVNPLDINELAASINTALTMDVIEQREHMARMQKRLIDYTVTDWVKDFLDQLKEVKVLQEKRKLKQVNTQIRAEITTGFVQAKTRHLFLDYDGTLVPFARHPREARPDSRLLELLNTLASEKRTEITIISGRNSDVLEEWFNDLPLNLVAEHGASIRMKGEGWLHERSIDQTWKPLIRPSFDMFVQRCPGSFVEEKNHTLAWHYRNVDDDLGFIRSRELLDNLYHLIRNAQLQVIDGNKVIEVRVAGVDKGTAARKVLLQRPAEFVLVIGDDKTDEDMFQALEHSAITIKVGQGITHAQYILPTQQQVLDLLTPFSK